MAAADVVRDDVERGMTGTPTMRPPTQPLSLTDPYPEEPDATIEPVRVWLTRRDGTSTVVETDARAMHDRSIVRHRGVCYAYMGTDQRDVPGAGKRWFRFYREVEVIDVGTMTVSEQKFP